MELVYPKTAQQRHSRNCYSLVFFCLILWQIFNFSNIPQQVRTCLVFTQYPFAFFCCALFELMTLFSDFFASLPVSLSLCFLFDRSHCGRAVCRLRHCHMPVAQTGHTSLLCHAQLCPRPERYVKRPRKISFLAPANRAICVRARTLPL